MTARTKALSVRARAAALWDDGDTRSNEEIAADLGAALSTVRDYHQQWNRANGQRNNRKLSPEIEVAVMEMRNNGGMQFPAIAEVLREDFGCEEANPHLVRECYLRGTDDVTVAVEVTAADVPVTTTAGLCWAVRFEPPNRSNAKRYKYRDFCDDCPHRAQCHEAACAGQFVQCERPLQFEMMEVTRC